MATARNSGRPTQRRRTNAAPAAAKAPARKAAPAPRKRDVTAYADKPATAYHKAMAKWIVNEVGYDPDTATSKRAAFLKGVSIATAARPAYMESDYLAEWRETSGEAKRGPKRAEETPTRGRRKPAPEPEDDFEDEEIEEDDDFEEEDDSESDDFDDEDSDEEDDSDDDDFEDEEEEPAPAPKRRAPARATSSKPAARSGTARKAPPAKKAAPAQRTSKPAADDDDFLF